MNNNFDDIIFANTSNPSNTFNHTKEYQQIYSNIICNMISLNLYQSIFEINEPK